MISKRLIWIAISNIFTIYWIFPRHPALPGITIHKGPSQVLLESPWVFLAISILIIGMMLEFFSAKAASWLNCSYYLTAIAVATYGLLSDRNGGHVFLGFVFYLLPMLVIFVADLWVYRELLFRKRNLSTGVAT